MYIRAKDDSEESGQSHSNYHYIRIDNYGLTVPRIYQSILIVHRSLHSQSI